MSFQTRLRLIFALEAAGPGERNAAAAQATAARLRDLDETRRLAYAVLLARTSGEGAVLVAALVNALAHHGLAVDPKDAAGHIQNLDRDESRHWLQKQINHITAELSGPSMTGLKLGHRRDHELIVEALRRAQAA